MINQNILQARYKVRAIVFPVLKIVIKTIIFVHTENVKRLNYIIDIHILLRHKRYYTEKGSLNRVNSFANSDPPHNLLRTGSVLAWVLKN